MEKVLGVETGMQPMERKAWLDAFYAGGWDVFTDDLVGDLAGRKPSLAYLHPSAEPGCNWIKPEYNAARDVATKLADRPVRYEGLAKAAMPKATLRKCRAAVQIIFQDLWPHLTQG